MLIFCLILLILAFLFFYVPFRDIFSPSIFMPLTWIGLLLIYFFLKPPYFPIQNILPFAIIVWTFSFSLCASIAYLTTSPPTGKTEPNPQVLRIYYIIILLSVPYIVFTLITAAWEKTNFFLYLRMINTGLDETIDKPEFGILSYFISLAFILYLIELYNYNSTKKIKITLLLIFNILLAFITMAKLSFFMLIFPSVFILYKKRRISRKMIFYVGIGFLGFIIILQSLRSQYDGTVDISSFFSTYLLSGSVAFDYLPEGHASNYWGENSFRFFYAIGKVFNQKIEVAPTILEYTYIPEPTNVFTVLYPFYTDFGFIGLVFFGGVYGILFGYVYKASKTSPVFLIFYSILIGYLILQFLGEFVFINLSTNIQYLFYLALPYLLTKKIRLY